MGVGVWAWGAISIELVEEAVGVGPVAAAPPGSLGAREQPARTSVKRAATRRSSVVTLEGRRRIMGEHCTPPRPSGLSSCRPRERTLEYPEATLERVAPVELLPERRGAVQTLEVTREVPARAVHAVGLAALLDVGDEVLAAERDALLRRGRRRARRRGRAARGPRGRSTGARWRGVRPSRRRSPSPRWPGARRRAVRTSPLTRTGMLTTARAFAAHDQSAAPECPICAVRQWMRDGAQPPRPRGDARDRRWACATRARARCASSR